VAHFYDDVVAGVGGGKQAGPKSLIDERACTASVAGEVGYADGEVVVDVVAPAGGC
jgi:hypothetical protein